MCGGILLKTYEIDNSRMNNVKYFLTKINILPDDLVKFQLIVKIEKFTRFI